MQIYSMHNAGRIIFPALYEDCQTVSWAYFFQANLYESIQSVPRAVVDISTLNSINYCRENGLHGPNIFYNARVQIIDFDS